MIGWTAASISNPLNYTNGIGYMTKWYTNTLSSEVFGQLGMSKKTLKELITSNPSTAFSTKDQSNAVVVTILHRANYCFTNAVTGGAFYWKTDSKSFELNPSIKSFFEDASRGGNKTYFKILDGDNDLKKFGINFSANNLSELNQMVAKEFLDIDTNINNYKPTSFQKSAPKTTPSKEQTEQYKILENAAIILYEGLHLNNPNPSNSKPELRKFSDWLKYPSKSYPGKSDQKTWLNYKEYLKEALSYFEKYIKTGHFYHSYKKLSAKPYLNKEFHDCFAEFKRQIVMDKGTVNGGASDITSEEKKFLENLDRIFSTDVEKCKDYFDPPPPPDLTLSWKQNKKNLEEILRHLTPGNFQKYKPQIQILDSSDNPILIFTTP